MVDNMVSVKLRTNSEYHNPRPNHRPIAGFIHFFKNIIAHKNSVQVLNRFNNVYFLIIIHARKQNEYLHFY